MRDKESLVPSADFPVWTLLSFPALVLGIAVLPMVIPRYWERRSFQILVTLLCTLPVVVYELVSGRTGQVIDGARSYLAFVITLGALFTASGGIHLEGDIEATPRTNTLFLLAGAVLASLIGTTGASMLLIRPLLKTNRQRDHRAHLVPFFILIVANAGGLLTPLGDPPLLVGYIEGVPFFWTLHLLPIWLLYMATFLSAFYVIDARAYERETRAALHADRSEVSPLALLGRRNLVFLLAIVPAALLPAGFREAALLAIALSSYFGTPRAVHQANSFSFGPITDVAIIFAGLFLSLGPIEVTLARAAPHLPLQSAWQLFWGSGLLSSVLDNAPTYTAFAALARGLVNHSSTLVAGIDPVKLAAISAGSVVMGATTYLGNGPNLMVKAVAESERYAMPSFVRYFVFAFGTMLPAHLIVTAAFWWLDR
ncbi:MAG TPA: sodium:proton antiporter [Polyangiaceae bacterium]|nr:sodium:proton antiporter [Polyangiaceae bacterium]